MSKEFKRDQRYFYKIKVTGVYDGDTITCTIGLGWDLELSEQKIRLAGIDTPEIRGKEKADGIVVRDFLRELILGKTMYIKTTQGRRRGKYGRWLGVLYLEPNEDGVSINQMLMDNGMAQEYI